jgi:hypothetical protein
MKRKVNLLRNRELLLEGLLRAHTAVRKQIKAALRRDGERYPRRDASLQREPRPNEKREQEKTLERQKK